MHPKFDKFFDAYDYVKKLKPDWEERILYLCAIDLLDGICHHPVQWRLRVDGNLETGLLTSDTYLLDDPVCKEHPERYMWVCDVCRYFHSGHKPPEPFDMHAHQRRLLAAALFAATQGDDYEDG